MNKDYSNEQWKAIEGYEGKYEVSDYGRVKSLTRRYAGAGGIMRGSNHVGGYRNVNLSEHGRARRFLIHRLVMAAFVSPCPDGLEVNHLDGDKHNNHLSNLEYVTRSENLLHANRVLHSWKIKDHGKRFDKDDLAAMRSMREHGMECSEICTYFDTDRGTISRILSGKMKWTNE